VKAATARAPREDDAREAKNCAANLATHVTLPTWVRFLRRGGRPSTPKGVGREAPLTAFPRGANDAPTSAGSDSAPIEGGVVLRCGFKGGPEHGRECGSGVRSHLALCCAGGWSQNADQPESAWDSPGSRDSSWSAFWDQIPIGGPGGCGRGLLRAQGTESVRCGREVEETKRERSGWALRLRDRWSQ